VHPKIIEYSPTDKTAPHDRRRTDSQRRRQSSTPQVDLRITDVVDEGQFSAGAVSHCSLWQNGDLSVPLEEWLRGSALT
jgi:hypothetical protein